MVTQPAWDLHATNDASDDDEPWHVLMGPGEVKVLSLEQLDDFFRLEVIDENTFVWQEGMQDWAPLSIVAGIDQDQEQDKPTVPLGMPPPSPAIAPAPVFSSVPPPTAVAPAAAPAPFPSTTPSLAPLPSPTAPPPAMNPSQAPSLAAPAPSPSTHPSLAPAHSGIAPTGATPWTSQASLAAPGLPTSLGDPWSTTTSKTQREPLTRRHWAILSLCALAGLLLTLYRNDLLRDMAHSAGMGATYESLEAVFGAPGFGTPRSVEPPVSDEPAEASPVSDTAAPALTAEASPPEPAAAPSEPQAKEEQTPPAKAEKTPSKPVSATRAAKPRPRPAAKPLPTKKLKGRNSEYDPMNAAL